MQKCCSPVRSYWLSRRCLFDVGQWILHGATSWAWWFRQPNNFSCSLFYDVNPSVFSCDFMENDGKTILSQWLSSDWMRQTEAKYYVSRLKALSLPSLTWVNLHLHGSILNNFKKVFQRWRKADISSTFDYTRKRVSLRNVDRMYVMSVSGRPHARTFSSQHTWKFVSPKIAYPNESPSPLSKINFEHQCPITEILFI